MEESRLLKEAARSLIEWFRENKRDLPWRTGADAYRVWVSEIMLQQTRVEAVKPYYERFLKELPGIKELAEAEEEQLLKLWEGLGYYNRVRNMQKAARKIMVEYQGEFPHTYEEIRTLPGIGGYTAGAVSAFAYGLPRAAVDGNVLRVAARLYAIGEDIRKAGVRSRIEKLVQDAVPEDAASDFGQGLIELGAVVCVPNGGPKCGECPLAFLCRAKKQGIQGELPVRSRLKERRIEKRTVFIFQDAAGIAIRRRPKRGLLAGLYELPNVEGHLTIDEATDYARSLGLTPVRIQRLQEAKHIFSHVEWHMTGYKILVDELEKNCSKELIFVENKGSAQKYPIPAAFAAYMAHIGDIG